MLYVPWVFSLTDSSKYCACVDGGGEGVQTTLKTDETILTWIQIFYPYCYAYLCLIVFSDTTTSPPWTPLYPNSRLEQEAIQYIHKFYCKDCQMDKQAAERAKAAAISTGEDSSTSFSSDSTNTDVKQEPMSPMSPQQMTDEASLMITLDKNKECK